MDEGADNEDEEEDEDDNEEKDEEDNDEDEDDEEEEDDEGEEDDDEEGDADEEEEDDDGISEDQKDFDAMLASGKLGLPTAPVVVPTAESLKLWGAMCQQHGEQPEEPLELSSQDFPAMAPPCDCHHCVLPAQPEPRVEVRLSAGFTQSYESGILKGLSRSGRGMRKWAKTLGVWKKHDLFVYYCSAIILCVLKVKKEKKCGFF